LEPDFDGVRFAAVDLADPDPAATVLAVVDLAVVVDFASVDLATVDLAAVVDLVTVDFAVEGRGPVDLAVVDFLAPVDLVAVDFAAGGAVVDWAPTAKAANRATEMELAIARKDPV
jgi:hypothetical protein